GAFPDRARLLLLHFPNRLSANNRASAATSARHVDHGRLRRRSHVASLDRCGRSRACFHNLSSAGNKASCTAKGRACALLFYNRADFEEYSTAEAGSANPELPATGRGAVCPAEKRARDQRCQNVDFVFKRA